MKYADWQKFIFTGITECAKFDVTTIENEENRVELLYRKLLDIINECGNESLGKNDQYGNLVTRFGDTTRN